MDCKTVRSLMDSPVLPEHKMIELEEHIEKCLACKAEYSFYINFTLDDELTFLHPAPLSETYESISLSECVMSRIWEENKWADPINRGTARVTPQRRLILVAMALILVIAIVLPLVMKWNASRQAAFALGSSTTDTLLSVNSLLLNPAEERTAPNKMKYGIIASTANPLLYNTEDKNNNFTVNYGLLASLFGILVTVVSISWLLRHSDNTDRSP